MNVIFFLILLNNNHELITVCKNTFCSIFNKINEITNEINGVKIQPIAILPILDRSMFRPPFARPIPIIAPTTACDCETGTSGNAGRFLEVRKLYNPSDEKTNNTNELDRTTINALIGDNLNILFPTVFITFLENVNTPTAIAIPPSKNNCCTPVNVIFPMAKS